MANKQGFVSRLLGNDTLRARLYDDLRDGSLSHAYILEGDAGSGKRTLARDLAAALACEKRENHGAGGVLPCGSCPSCRKVLEGKSPDVIRIGRGERASIGVDDVRFLRSDVLVEPNDLENKIYVIEDADAMTVQAQNALLLTLEEPPPYVLFLLLCRNATMLLETIRSRAPILRLRPVPDAPLRQCLTETSAAYVNLPAEEQRALVLMANGSIGRARELLQDKARKVLMDRRRWVRDWILCRADRKSYASQLEVMQAVGTGREEAVVLLAEAERALCDLLMLKKSDDAPLGFFTDRDAALELSARFSAGALLQWMEKTEQARGQLLRNGNVRLVLTELILV